MLSLKGCALAGLLLLCVVLQGWAAPVNVPNAVNQAGPAAANQGNAKVDAATLTLQFDNRAKTVTNSGKRQKVIDALAKNVFLVDPRQVTLVSGLDQSGLLTSQSVVTFRAVGPTTNRKTVLQNCKDNTGSRWLGLHSSVAESEVKKATDTWFPNDAVRIQKADCAAAV